MNFEMMFVRLKLLGFVIERSCYSHEQFKESLTLILWVGIQSIFCAVPTNVAPVLRDGVILPYFIVKSVAQFLAPHRKKFLSSSTGMVSPLTPQSKYVPFRFLSAYPWGSRDVAAFFPPEGYTLDESPAHRRTLTDGSGCLTRCQLHIRSNFGVQYLAQGYFGM